MYYNYSLGPYGRRWETLKAGVRNFLFFIEFGFTEACDVNADAICGSPYSLVCALDPKEHIHANGLSLPGLL